MAAASVLADQQIVIDLSAKKFQCMVSKDLDALAALLHDQLTFIHSNAWIENKQEVRAAKYWMILLYVGA